MTNSRKNPGSALYAMYAPGGGLCWYCERCERVAPYQPGPPPAHVCEAATPEPKDEKDD